MLVSQVQQAKAAPPAINPEQLQPLSADFVQWFSQRGISQQTLARNGIMMQQRYCAAEGMQMSHIAFPYYRNGSIVNVKYRALPKHFSQTKGGEQIFYGYDDAKVGELRLHCCPLATCKLMRDVECSGKTACNTRQDPLGCSGVHQARESARVHGQAGCQTALVRGALVQVAAQNTHIYHMKALTGMQPDSCCCHATWLAPA
jgi:hypothetical protein